MRLGRKRTGREAVNRIVWDDRLDPAAFVVGYVDRLASTGVRETPLPAWEDRGDVPAHRISFIRCGAVVVWSRGEAGDLLADAALPREAWAIHQPTPEEAAPSEIRR